ncbi:MAG: alcohol dehydrogenase class IV [Candidatus Binatia bacterium]|jgi:alcohol dehydrogenase class IV
MRTFWTFASAGQLTFGRDAIKEIGRMVRDRSWSRALIVTDKNILEAGIVDLVANPLREAEIEVDVFDEGEAEPSVDAALNANDRAAEFKPDVIVGLGGGSNMDLAKIVAVLHRHGGQPSDYFGFNRVPGPVVPVICVPTTSGTGSEVSHSAVLTDSINKIKVSTLSPFLRPARAIVDPKLTVSCPSKATAESGIDALTHAIEAFTAIDSAKLDVPTGEPTPYCGRTPLGDLLAQQAIALIGEHLRTAVKKPTNLDAREGMSLAATLAGMAFSNCGVAVVHALEYPIGAAVHCSHGAGNGLLLPYVIRFNLPERPAEFRRIAHLLGEETPGNSDEEAGEICIATIEKLKRDIGIPERLSEIGVTQSQLPEFAKKSFEITRLMKLNPRPPKEEDLLKILKDAY